jgi:replicative DNA helicase
LKPKNAITFTPIRSALDQAFYEIDKAHEDPSRSVDIESAYSFLNHILIDNDRPCFSIISVPKFQWATSLGASITAELSRRYGRAVGYFSQRVSSTDLASQMVSFEARLDHNTMISGGLPSEHWPRLSVAAGGLADSSIHIDDTKFITVKAIRRRLKDLTNNSKIDLVIIDNLQFISCKSILRHKDRNNQRICQALRGVSEELNVSILLLSQFPAEYNPSSIDVGVEFESLPFLKDYRNMPDAVLYLAQGEPEGEARPFDLHICYNQKGPTGVIKLMRVYDDGGFLEYHNFKQGRRVKEKTK